MEKKNQVAKQQQQKNITEQVLAKINDLKDAGELRTHKNYSVENALKSAFLKLVETEDMNKKPVLESCTRESIANALLNMVTSGLNVMKNQCYFVAYAGKLNYQRSYIGSMTILKRDAGGKTITSQAVYAKDKFSFAVDAETGIKKILEHEQTLDSLSTAVVGAYTILTFDDGSVYTEIMNIKQIEAAWNQRKGNGLSPAHKNFPDEMAKKVVVNRACKPFINATDDENLFDEDDPQILDKTVANTNHEIEQNANKESMSFEDAEVIEEKEVVTKPVQGEPKGELFPEQQTEIDPF